MRDDLRAALRSLRSSPGFTAAALLLLTLGIGATTSIVSVVDAVLLRRLPFDEPERLVAVGERTRDSLRVGGMTQDPQALEPVAPQNYLDWAAQQQVFESIAAIASDAMTLGEPGTEPEAVRGQRVSADFFTALRVRPSIGRTFTARNEIAGGDRVAILSHGLWRRRFGADPAIVGRSVSLVAPGADKGARFQVIGVMPPDFSYPVGPAPDTDIWIPYVVPPDERVRDPRRFRRYLQVIARLRPGVSLEQAREQMDRVAGAIERAHPTWNRDTRIGVRLLHDQIVGGRIRSWMWLLLGTVGLLLLIACANVANLLLARASARQRELGVRAALGASRWRLVRQLMTEGFVLSAAGTACAMLLAWGGVRLLEASAPADLPRVDSITLDWRVLAAAAGLSVLTGILFGLFPALQSSSPDLWSALRTGAHASASQGARRVRNILVITEVAMALVLLVGAALFIGSFMSLLRIDPGLDPEHVLVAHVSPPAAAPGRVVDDILDRVGGIPGVMHAAVSDGVPLKTGIRSESIPDRRTAWDVAPDEPLAVRRVTPTYHRALGIPLRRGRLFNEADRASARAVVVISASAARRFFPGQDPVGRTIKMDGFRTVVGVVGDVHQFGLETEPQAEVYVPVTDAVVSRAHLIIRTTGNPYDVLPAVRAAVFASLPDTPLRDLDTMDRIVAGLLAPRRFTMLLLGLFGVLGLAIAAVGVYGVLAYTVSQRTRELGVRVALGATTSRLVLMVMREGGTLVLAGLFIGGVAAWYLSAASEAFLFRLEPTDPRAFFAAIVCLSLAALAASVMPARRASGVDPVAALRAE